MNGQTIVLSSPAKRDEARRLIGIAPEGAIVNVRKANRSAEQNAYLWALLSDVSRAKPEGREHTPDTWKALFMQACGWAIQFEVGLDGRPFPLGFRSSRMTAEEMSNLIEFILVYCAEHNIGVTS